MNKPSLVENSLLIIAIVLLLAGLAATVHYVTWRNHRGCGSQQQTCIANLKQIDGTKEQFALEHHRVTGDPVNWDNLVPEFIRNVPACPQNGTYTIGVIGTAPTCTVKGHVLP